MHLQLLILAVLRVLQPASAQLDAKSDTCDALNRSFYYIEKGHLDSAEVCLVTTLAENPDNPLNPFIFNNLGTIRRRMGHLDSAFVAYSAALAALPLNALFLEERASLLIEMNQSENAIHDYSTLLDVQPANEEALYQRGLLYLQTGRDDLAEADFRRMMEINQNGTLPRLGLAALAKFRNDFDEAEKIYSYLLEKTPDNPHFYAGRAELYLLMDKPGKASADATRAIKLSKTENPYLYIIRYRAKLKLHEKEGAEKDLQRARELGYR